MFQKARENNYIESSSLLSVGLRWRKPLLIVSMSAAVISFIFSGHFFITPLYKSTVVFFPTATNSISKALLDVNASDKQDILAFGQAEQVEQVIQILNSDDIKNALIHKYDLMNHYGISPSAPYPMTTLYDKYQDRINFHQTEYASIRIDVLDADPQMAADMANDIASLADSVKSRLQRTRALQALKIVEDEYHLKERSIKEKEDSLQWLSSKGVMDYKNQAVIWNEEYAKAFSSYNNEVASLAALLKNKPEMDTAVQNTKVRIEGAQSRVSNLKSKLDLLSKYGGANMSLNEQLNLDREELNKIKVQYSKLKIDAEQQLPHQFIIDHAVKAEKSAYPVRWLIVVISTFCASLLAFIVVIIIDRFRFGEY